MPRAAQHGKAFAGRVVFDHLPKTGGQAVNAWLVEQLGSACVTPNLDDQHRDLIRQWGGLYSIVSGHVHFYNGEGLDPRYQYVTLFREPVDRVVSWLYFVVNNHTCDQELSLVPHAKRFIETEGRELAEPLRGAISNFYVEHFCRVLGNGLENEQIKYRNAIAAIRQYDLVGRYEEMPTFLADLAALFGLMPPVELARINVTKSRPKVDDVSASLRERIKELNQWDLRLYDEIRNYRRRKTEAIGARVSPTGARWQKFEHAAPRVVTSSDLAIVAASLQGGGALTYDDEVCFEVEIRVTRPLRNLAIGIHINDSQGRRAFGTNNLLQGMPQSFLAPGNYRVNHQVKLALPAGKYFAGFAFAECTDQGYRELAWFEQLCEFHVRHRENKPSEGYADLPASMQVSPMQSAPTIEEKNGLMSRCREMVARLVH